MDDRSFVLKGNVLYSEGLNAIRTVEGGYVVCVDGVSKGVFTELPVEFGTLPLHDCGDNLIVPGLVDLHVHAPQFGFRGTSMDLELMEWLNENAFPEETKFSDNSYASRAYSLFVGCLRASATTRVVAFGTRHREATEILMDEMEASGLVSYIGKVNMDRLAPEALSEESAEVSLEETRKWLDDIKARYENTKPIITPRFIPSCSDELMEGLGEIVRETGLPVQSHLSENFGEIQSVRELVPSSLFYGDAYEMTGMFGSQGKAIMAHCVHSGLEEIALMKKNGVFVAHCPESNENLSSGVAPIRTYLDEGLNVGLGSDIAGGTTESIFFAMTQAIQASKIRWRLMDQSLKPLTFAEAFYLGTLGGGRFFGKVGSFEEGYEFDALVLSDEHLPYPGFLPPVKRLERFAYLFGDQKGIRMKFVKGRRLF